jgi:hypothetical protein
MRFFAFVAALLPIPLVFFLSFDPETTSLFPATFYQLALVNTASTLSYLIFYAASCASHPLFTLRYTTSRHSFLSSRWCVYGFRSFATLSTGPALNLEMPVGSSIPILSIDITGFVERRVRIFHVS